MKSVMKLAGRDENFVVGNFIDKAMLLAYPTRPISRKFVFERLGLSDAGKRSAANVFYKFVNFCECLFVLRPFLIVRKRGLGKRNFHSAASSMECTAPDSICEIERSRCSRFASVERRYSVSSSTSRTKISILRPKNIFFSESRKFKFSSSQFNENVLCIKTPVKNESSQRKLDIIKVPRCLCVAFVKTAFRLNNYSRKRGESPQNFSEAGK